MFLYLEFVIFIPLKNIISISLSFVVLIQSFGIGLPDMEQIDELIEHAQFHNETYGDNFLVFVSKHYGELKAEHNKQNQEEKEDHEQLPFQHHASFNSLTATVLFTHKIEFSFPDFSENKIHQFHYQEASSSMHLEGILQPPRLS